MRFAKSPFRKALLTLVVVAAGALSATSGTAQAGHHRKAAPVTCYTPCYTPCYCYCQPCYYYDYCVVYWCNPWTHRYEIYTTTNSPSYACSLVNWLRCNGYCAYYCCYRIPYYPSAAAPTTPSMQAAAPAMQAAPAPQAATMPSVPTK